MLFICKWYNKDFNKQCESKTTIEMFFMGLVFTIVSKRIKQNSAAT